MLYHITGYESYKAYDKVYFTIEASSEEEAMKLVKENPEEYVQDSKLIDMSNSEYVDFSEWTVHSDA